LLIKLYQRFKKNIWGKDRYTTPNDISIVRAAWYWNGAATMLILPREILSVN
jgi:hypothetical protein